MKSNNKTNHIKEHIVYFKKNVLTWQNIAIILLVAVLIYLLYKNFTRDEQISNINYPAVEHRLDSLEQVQNLKWDTLRTIIIDIKKREDYVSKDSIKIFSTVHTGKVGRAYRDSLRAIYNAPH